MTAVLIACALILAWFAVEGFRHGVVRRIVELVGLVLIFVFASRLAGDIEPVLVKEWDFSPRVSFFASWAFVLVGGVLGVRLLAALLGKLVRFSIVGWLDRTGGVLLGLLFGAIVASCLLIVLLASPIDGDFKHELRRNQVSGVVVNFAPSIYDVARRAWDGDRFFDMVEQHVEPAARKAAESLKAAVDELGRDDDDPPRQ